MDRKVVEQLEPSLAHLRSACGRVVRITESISRLRDREFGHDRHFATRSSCYLRLGSVSAAFSGSALMLGGKIDGRDVEYQIALEVVTSFDIQPMGAVIVEQFEQHTERRSEILFEA